MKHSFKLTAFSLTPVKELIAGLDNKKLNNQGSILYKGIGWLNELDFYTKEVPRNDLCLMSTDIIPYSKGKNFLEQTFLLTKFISRSFPAIKNSLFWKEIEEELLASKAYILDLIEQKKISEAGFALSKLMVNKHFRPNANEIIQSLIALERETGICNLSNGYTWSNSINPNDGKILSIGMFTGSGGYYNLDSVEHSFDFQGCTFISDFNLIKQYS